MADIALSASVRSAVLNLRSTNDLIERTNNRLATGLRVASPIDDARIFFEARALTDRASDLNEKKDGIDQGISSLNTALEAADSIDSLVRQAKGIAISAKTATGSELTDLVTQYNEVLSQIDLLSGDASYQGLNLVNGTGSTLEVSFSNDTASVLTVASVDLTTDSTGLDLTSAATGTVGVWDDATGIDNSINELDAALSTIRGNSQTLGSNVAILQTRLDFTEQYVDTLEQGGAKLTLADVTEEGANLVALQTRQQLGISSLAFAGQSEQQILALFA